MLQRFIGASKQTIIHFEKSSDASHDIWTDDDSGSDYDFEEVEDDDSDSDDDDNDDGDENSDLDVVSNAT